MKNKTALVLVVLMAAALFTPPAVLSQTENTAEATFYVH